MKGWRPPRAALVVFASIVAVGAGSAALLAAIPDSHGVVHACYHKTTGLLRVIDDSKASCQQNEAALSWSQTGPQGPAGPQGPPGANGDPGAPATALWAVVGSDGTLINGSGVLSVSHPRLGDYFVQFDRPVRGCAAVANPSDVPPGGIVIILVTDVLEANDMKSPFIVDPRGNSVDANFQMAVFC